MPVCVHHGFTPETIQKFTRSRPVFQLDVVSTASEELRDVLLALRASYYRSVVTFAEVFSIFDAKISTIALSTGSQDAWFIDNHCVLTLTLTRDTYESLNIVGTQSGSSDMFLVTLDLRDSSRQAARARDCLRRWDARRAEAGKVGWDALFSSPPPSYPRTMVKWDAEPFIKVFHDVRIPSGLPSITSEDAHEELSTLLEWIGLASLGSQRLQVNDAVNPYVASCSFPTSWHIGSTIHVRWEGMLVPTFVESVLDTCLRAAGLVAITLTPLPHERSARAWSLVLYNEKSLESGGRPKASDWIVAECNK